ncbi:apolipoprotein N-acyltransferase [Agrobacterium sp.]|jgi:apolipoprotein N-acyltransferase|uniref:apolipoprotein N-acyltransferase n=1 Tax=Agrobacterium sp. TaxID=361 RepID=UPI0028A9D0C8|nr:apolipoprotein N-acyltransferase [Agrobacterium sp.]
MERLAGKVMLLGGFRRGLLAIAAGAIGALALPPFGFFAALFLSFTLLVWLMDGSVGSANGGGTGRWWSSVRIGWLFGFGYFVAGLWWLGNALLLEADEFAWALPLAILGLPAVLALFYGLATGLAHLLWSEGLGRLTALAAAFGLAEWLRSFVATGFPWNAIGYGAMPIPVMMQSSHAIGLFGVSMLAVYVFAAPALLGTRKGAAAGIGLAVILAAAHLGYGAYRLYTAPARNEDGLTVRIVQPAIDQSRKLENTDRAAIFEEHLSLTASPVAAGKKRPDIIIWPETSVPFILTQNPDALVRIADVLEDGQVLLTGAVRSEEAAPGMPPRFYNSIYMIDSQGQILGAADKVHLVPFGEYVPFENILTKWGIENIVNLPGGFSAAANRSLLTLPSGQSFYPLICYEAIFPNEIANGLSGASLLLNITNDGWFGQTPGPSQHFLQARLRAVENGVGMIRAANNGISAIIDPMGQIVAGLANGQKGVFDATLSSGVLQSVDNGTREDHFWLIFGALLIIAIVSRLGLVFKGN